jgi:hypothetical protein
VPSAVTFAVSYNIYLENPRDEYTTLL